ncbi:unnamed protein product [Parnassius mnemosyne]|uniref:Chitin-binding type-2 domain-containing protein n=1 Tax=Parnassius mnemosyne TaxID=213953 RepID=A0AAV1K9H8_9NEOP
MLEYYKFLFYTILISHHEPTVAFLKQSFDCGPYGFVCEGTTKLRLCEGDNLLGPAFNCPANTVCNEDSSDVCENTINYIDPAISRTVRCHRNERIADPSVADCKGYILCIPNKNRFQGIKFKCSGTTIFNGYTRTCSSPDTYKCPMTNITKTTSTLYHQDNRRMDTNTRNNNFDNLDMNSHWGRPIDCKNYKFAVTQDKSPVRAKYFCPTRPVRGESAIRCTIFSNQFCITLERDEKDSFIQPTGAAYRKPRSFVVNK